MEGGLINGTLRYISCPSATINGTVKGALTITFFEIWD